MALYAVKFMEGQTIGYKSEQVALEKFQRAHRQWRFGLREEEPEYLGLVEWDQNSVGFVPVDVDMGIAIF